MVYEIGAIGKSQCNLKGIECAWSGQCSWNQEECPWSKDKVNNWLKNLLRNQEAKGTPIITGEEIIPELQKLK